METDIITALLLEEEGDDDETLLNLVERSSTSQLYKTRLSEGAYNLLIKNHLMKGDGESFVRFLRLNKDQFNFVFELIKEEASKPATVAVHTPITPEEKLALTLRFLATGESYASLGYGFRISKSYVSIIVREMLEILCKVLIPIFLPPPTKDTFFKNAKEFYNIWGFPNCCAAIDGKHIRMRCPDNSGSLYYNYKGFFSIVLLALVDANCKFIAVDVGSYGKEGDSGIFNKSNMGKEILNGNLFPENTKLPYSDIECPFVIVGDEAFRLHNHIMKPYTRAAAEADPTKAKFNFHLSRARRVSENAFGILCQIFRVFHTLINVKHETCNNIILASCCLHNLLRESYLKNKNTANPAQEQQDQEPLPQNIRRIARPGGFSSSEGFKIREDLKSYFNQ